MVHIYVRNFLSLISSIVSGKTSQGIWFGQCGTFHYLLPVATEMELGVPALLKRGHFQHIIATVRNGLPNGSRNKHLWYASALHLWVAYLILETVHVRMNFGSSSCPGMMTGILGQEFTQVQHTLNQEISKVTTTLSP